LKKGVRFEWSTECQQAFDTLKLKLMTEPILALPTDEGTYILDADASNFCLGTVLFQEQFGTERVIAYSSRTMSRAEQKYDTTKKELLAVVNGLKQFRKYLYRTEFCHPNGSSRIIMASAYTPTHSAISPMANSY